MSDPQRDNHGKYNVKIRMDRPITADDLRVVADAMDHGLGNREAFMGSLGGTVWRFDAYTLVRYDVKWEE